MLMFFIFFSISQKQLTPRQGTKTFPPCTYHILSTETTYAPSGDENSSIPSMRCGWPSETTYAPSGDESMFLSNALYPFMMKQLTPRQGTKTFRALRIPDRYHTKQLTPRQGTKICRNWSALQLQRFETTYTPSGDENCTSRIISDAV